MKSETTKVFNMDEPNEESRAAIEEARSKKDYSDCKRCCSDLELFADLVRNLLRQNP